MIREGDTALMLEMRVVVLSGSSQKGGDANDDDV